MIHEPRQFWNPILNAMSLYVAPKDHYGQEIAMVVEQTREVATNQWVEMLFKIEHLHILLSRDSRKWTI